MGIMGCPQVADDAGFDTDVPVETDADGHTDVGEPGLPSTYKRGRPMRRLSRIGERLVIPTDGSIPMVDIVPEMPDVAAVDRRYSLAAMPQAVAVLDHETRERTFLRLDDASDLQRVSADGKLAVFAGETGPLVFADLNGLPELALTEVSTDANQQIAVDVLGDRVLVAQRSDGALLLDAAGAVVAQLGGSDVQAVALMPGRALFGDGDEVVVMDLTTATPVELLRVDVGGAVRNLSADDAHVAVALGGRNVAVYRWVDDTLELFGPLVVPGPANDVALMGDHLWVASWRGTNVAWLGGDRPFLLGHEPSPSYTLQVDVFEDEVVTAGWWFADRYRLNPNKAAPVLYAPEHVVLGAAGQVTWRVQNMGWMDLEIDLAASELTVDQASLVVPPGGYDAIDITVVGEVALPVDVAVTTNDPAFDDTTLQVRAAASGIGTEHPEVESLGFHPPSVAPTTYTLSEQRGRVMVLSYFAYWCGICGYELPDLEASIVPRYDPADVGFWLVNVDPDVTAAKAYILESGITLPVLLDGYGTYPGYDRTGNVLEAPFPVRVVIGADGVTRWVGFRVDEDAEFLAAIDAAVADLD